MSSPLPLLMLFCFGLIVYAFDLANVGGGIIATATNASSSGGGGSSSNNKGFYTLCAIWIGWIVLSIVVGYDTIFLGDAITTTTTYMSDFDDEGESQGINNSSSRGIATNFISLMIILTKLGASIILLFCLAAWTTLQFQWLPYQIPTLARFFERVIHFTLPPISAAMIAYELTASTLSSSYITSWGVDLAFPRAPLALTRPRAASMPCAS